MGEISASLGRRLAALVLDWGASILVALLAFPAFPYGSLESLGATMAIFVLEVVVLTWLTGASFGQRILGLRVVSVTAAPLSLPRVLLRTLLIVLVIPAIVTDEEGRGLHDRVAGTIVLYVR